MYNVREIFRLLETNLMLLLHDEQGKFLCVYLCICMWCMLVGMSMYVRECFCSSSSPFAMESAVDPNNENRHMSIICMLHAAFLKMQAAMQRVLLTLPTLEIFVRDWLVYIMPHLIHSSVYRQLTRMCVRCMQAISFTTILTHNTLVKHS
jgi:hypothetical protein